MNLQEALKDVHESPNFDLSCAEGQLQRDWYRREGEYLNTGMPTGDLPKFVWRTAAAAYEFGDGWIDQHSLLTVACSSNFIPTEYRMQLDLLLRQYVKFALFERRCVRKGGVVTVYYRVANPQQIRHYKVSRSKDYDSIVDQAIQAVDLYETEKHQGFLNGRSSNQTWTPYMDLNLRGEKTRKAPAVELDSRQQQRLRSAH